MAFQRTTFLERVLFRRNGGTPPFHSTLAEVERELFTFLLERQGEGRSFFFRLFINSFTQLGQAFGLFIIDYFNFRLQGMRKCPRDSRKKK